jgi:hypothetical protein
MQGLERATRDRIHFSEPLKEDLGLCEKGPARRQREHEIKKIKIQGMPV